MRKQQLKTRRTKLKLTQAELAKQLGVAWRTYARWETEGNIPAIVEPALQTIERDARRKWNRGDIQSNGGAVRQTSDHVRPYRHRGYSFEYWLTPEVGSGKWVAEGHLVSNLDVSHQTEPNTKDKAERAFRDWAMAKAREWQPLPRKKV